MSDSEQLLQADQAAQELRGSDQCEVYFALEVLVQDGSDTPRAKVGVELQDGTGRRMRTRTLRDGTARFEGLDKDTPYQLTLFEVDRAHWSTESEQTLSGKLAKSSEAAVWEKAGAVGAEALTHRIEEGECVEKLGLRYGLDPELIWAAEENQALAEQRGAHTILDVGDEVFVPQRRAKLHDVKAGMRYVLALRPIESRLRVRFLDIFDDPRAGEEYVVALETASGEVLPDREGKLDDEGFLDETVPPDVTTAAVTLGAGGDEDVYTLRPSCLKPHNALKGAQDRLRNLGYHLEDEDGMLGDATRAALEDYQRRWGLDPSGELDDETAELLAAEHLS